MSKKKVVIIGSGFGGLASACIFGKAGYDVTVIEKNAQFGGRAGLIEVKKDKSGQWSELPKTNNTKKHGKSSTFRFDSGPSWYLMPDVFEHFFDLIGEKPGKQLDLVRLNPSYQVVFKDTLLGSTKIYGDLEKDAEIFEAFEPQGGRLIKDYVADASYKYETAINNFLYKNYDHIGEFINKQMLTEGRKLNALSNMQKFVSKWFQSREIQKILQYPLVFLGSSPYKAPALYSLLSHVDFKQGVFYPQGGIYRLTQVLIEIAKKHGVKFVAKTPVEKIVVNGGRAKGVLAGGKEYKADIVVSNADIKFTDSQLLDPQYKAYSERYWRKRVLAPSALLIHLGVKGQYSELNHHNLVFSRDWDKNFKEIFGKKKFPSDPSFYVCNPNKTDPNVAPKGHENLSVLVPVSAGVSYDDKKLEDFTEKTLITMEKVLHLKDLRKNIVYRKTYCAKDFESDFNSYKGTALGLAHTLRQTAVFRPNNQHKKIPNLLFAGANTNPGIGLPMCLISAELAYKRVINDRSSQPLKTPLS